MEKKREEEQDLIRNKKNICRVKAVIYLLICLIIVVLSVLVIRMISKNAYLLEQNKETKQKIIEKSW